MMIYSARDKGGSQETRIVIQVINDNMKEGSHGGSGEAGQILKNLGAKLPGFHNCV